MKNKLKALFKRNPDRSFKRKEIAKRLNLESDDDYQALKVSIHQLEQEKFLSKIGKRYKLHSFPAANKITGYFQLNNRGFGFVVPKNPEIKDIFISAGKSSTAFHGDLVEVELFARQKGRNLEGQITAVIRRKRKEVVGLLHFAKSFHFISPDDARLHRDIYINSADLNGAKPGDKVMVGDIIWENSMLNPLGTVKEVLGKKDSLDTEVNSICKEFGIPTSFSIKTVNEAELIDFTIDEKAITERIDLREKIIFTIDPQNAKDFDDALSIEELDNGNYRVGVHIADVSYYVKAGSQLDKEAKERGNSTYLVARAIPMLPEKLSNNICSLIPMQERLTFSVFFEISPKSKVINYQIAKTIIKSKRRFTYDEVQKIIETGKGEFSYEIGLLNKLAVMLRQKRFKEGSLEFFTPEVEFVLDSEGYPLSIKKKEISESNMLVEEFMLLANKTVAEKCSKLNSVPFIYRVHDFPGKEKLEEFARFVKSLGYTFNLHAGKAALQFNRLMESVKGTEEESVVNELAIRSMAKAIYSPQNIGHYGLGFKYYTHFTSPIRRYSDLLVHRILDRLINKKSGKYYSLEQLDKICEHISATERNSLEAERFSVKQKQVQFLRDKVGEEFHAVISGIASFGIFVELTDILAEGLIRVKDLEGDFYVFDDKKYSLIGRRTKKQYRLGDRILVQLIRADTDNSELDFIIKENRQVK
ncbi:ribonuclease R [Candidatus Parcubacteria bacterium]|nr:MAG: ribonuclease R [Candidatus Parcubacteria bacterium]